MSAGTIVITGGILAAVILLVIVAVLCYCRLQYYCCKRTESEVGSVGGADPLSHSPCNACDALAMDGTAISPASLDQLDSGSQNNSCPSCSPFLVRSGLSDELSNGGERLGFHTYYENPSFSLSSASLSYHKPSEGFAPPQRAYSTDV
ncbi:protein FAM163A-like [Gouania willdenowi]|uniref:Protein FAM163A-like n=1 Tax=Gouania willdenowi TaxID=441366 RepID=A0A8C5I359_GOUWI|nr:protein FAM163A-like [Gouania willdenowi]